MIFKNAMWEFYDRDLDSIFSCLKSSNELAHFLSGFPLNGADRQAFILLLSNFLCSRQWQIRVAGKWDTMKWYWPLDPSDFHNCIVRLARAGLIHTEFKRDGLGYFEAYELSVILMPHVRYGLFGDSERQFRDVFSLVAAVTQLTRDRDYMPDQVFMEELEHLTGSIPECASVSSTLSSYSTIEKAAFLYALNEFCGLDASTAFFDALLGGEQSSKWPTLQKLSGWLFRNSPEQIRFMVEFRKMPIVSAKVMSIGTESANQEVRISDKIVAEIMKSEPVFTQSGKKLIERQRTFSGLIYPESMGEEMQRLQKAIRQYERLSSSMKGRFGASGLCVLFHGGPGTGKTASAYELAKKTGRKLINVDISEIRNMWYGSTQKNARQVFSDYRQALVAAKKAPILLLNEADAVISRRLQAAHSTDDTENSLKNIFLEEMEQFQGILIA
ncbi:MAG: ATP-binding protein, partial [Candidatus Wallbacteria bacterium]|nr:ATP-binding protein [Candidatus Wallbacteria bacterium]